MVYVIRNTGATSENSLQTFGVPKQFGQEEHLKSGLTSKVVHLKRRSVFDEHKKDTKLFMLRFKKIINHIN